MYDPQAGRNYYIDHNTRTTSWDRPAPAGPPQTAPPAQNPYGYQAQAQTYQGLAPPAPKQPQMPPQAQTYPPQQAPQTYPPQQPMQYGGGPPQQMQYAPQQPQVGIVFVDLCRSLCFSSPPGQR